MLKEIDNATLVGLVMGALNALWSAVNVIIILWNRYVHMRLVAVKTYPYTPVGTRSEVPELTVCVTNLSAFNVYVQAVGFSSRTWYCSSCGVLSCNFLPLDLLRTNTSYELKSRETLRLSVPSNVFGEAMRTNKYVYVRTDCGYFRTSRIRVKS